MYEYVLHSVVKISIMFAKYFEYYTIILRGRFSWTRCISFTVFCLSVAVTVSCTELNKVYGRKSHFRNILGLI